MDQLWKWVMHLNAKAFCLAATLGFFMVAAFCGWGVLHPTEPLKDGGNGSLPELPPAWAPKAPWRIAGFFYHPKVDSRAWRVQRKEATETPSGSVCASGVSPHVQAECRASRGSCPSCGAWLSSPRSSCGGA